VGRLRLRPSELRGLIAETGELYQRFRRVSLDGFVSAEVALRQEPAPGVVLKGVVDAVFGGDGRVRLVDWKTGQLGRARDQLMFYATLWALEHGVLPLRVEAVSLATGERFELAPDASDAAACLEVTAELVERARESFSSDIPVERIAGPWCRYCPVVADCEEGSSAAALTG
jgi:hypothetical protein